MKSRHAISKLRQSLLLLLGTLLLGVAGFRLVEDYTLLDALYMTIITMSTVGFGTLGELSGEGKLFSVLLIVISTGTFVYAVTTLTTFVIEGEIRQLFNSYQFNKKVSKLRDHIILCGLGRNGREAALELIRQQRPFLIIETDEKVIAELAQHHPDLLFVKGDATHEEILTSANIAHARGLISALSSDAENVYITLTARGLNPYLFIIARASNASSVSKLRRAGADHIIVPNMIGGRKIADLITRPARVEFIDLITGAGNPDLHLEDIACAGHPKLLGRTLAELHIRSHTGVLVLGYKRGEREVELNPNATVPIAPED
ncbi:MAG: potassium channel protein [Bacteroidia bacterium]